MRIKLFTLNDISSPPLSSAKIQYLYLTVHPHRLRKIFPLNASLLSHWLVLLLRQINKIPNISHESRKSRFGLRNHDRNMRDLIQYFTAAYEEKLWRLMQTDLFCSVWKQKGEKVLLVGDKRNGEEECLSRFTSCFLCEARNVFRVFPLSSFVGLSPSQAPWFISLAFADKFTFMTERIQRYSIVPVPRHSPPTIVRALLCN